MINKILSTILINSAILYIVAKYIPQLWFELDIQSGMVLELFFLLWLIFWIINDVVKRIVNFLALPLRFLTAGLFSLVISVWMFYVFEYIVNYLDNEYGLWVVVDLGDIWQVILLAIVIYLLNLIFKKL